MIHLLLALMLSVLGGMLLNGVQALNGLTLAEFNADTGDSATQQEFDISRRVFSFLFCFLSAILFTAGYLLAKYALGL